MNNSKKRAFDAHEIAFCGLCAAIICIFAPIAIPTAGGVPVSLATFAIYIVSAVSERRRALVSVALYVLAGAVGVPVFSGFSGGFHVLVGSTGGFLIGYAPCALIIATLARNAAKRPCLYPVGMILGTAVCYALGTAWFALLSGCGASAAFAACVVPFVVFDIVKIAVASALAIMIGKKLNGVDK